MLRLHVLNLCHERIKHMDAGRLMDKLHEDYWWPLVEYDSLLKVHAFTQESLA